MNNYNNPVELDTTDDIIKDSITLKELFNNYRKKTIIIGKKLDYAKNVNFDDKVNAIKEIVNILESELIVA